MEDQETIVKKGLLFDGTRCIGCGACYVACKEKNNLPHGEGSHLQDQLSAKTYTVVQKHGDLYQRRLCMHCTSPACASVCPVRALEKSPGGPVLYHEDRCIGCRYCMQACPFGAPRYEWDKLAPRIHKCTLCPDRLEAGRPTACAEACPAEATVCGTLDELVAEARRRMRSAPGRYHDRIYGLEGLGGGSVLMISSRPLEDLGLYPRGAGNEPLPDLTWKVLKKIPSAVAVGGILLGGIWWITLRRMEIQDEALRATARGDAARGAPAREDGATESGDARSAPSGK